MIDYSPEQPLRYRMRRRDAKGESVREVLESRDGSVARLVQRNGQALTVAEDKAERDRLQEILADPETYKRHVRHEDGSRGYATELLRALPGAMVWAPVPGQPQLPGATGTAIVLDFTPDPRYKPPSLVTEALTGVAGRAWIDARSHSMTRIECRTLHSVDFGWGGVLARIRTGGTVELEQQRAPNGRWLYSHMVEHITIREILVHTVEENAEMFVSDVQPLASPVSVQEAVQRLLALPVPVR